MTEGVAPRSAPAAVAASPRLLKALGRDTFWSMSYLSASAHTLPDSNPSPNPLTPFLRGSRVRQGWSRGSVPVFGGWRFPRKPRPPDWPASTNQTALLHKFIYLVRLLYFGALVLCGVWLISEGVAFRKTSKVELCLWLGGCESFFWQHSTRFYCG